MASAVFVSFHDEDTRHDIAGFLLNPLRSRGILVFAKGESGTFDLFQTIERSRLFIVVLSENYASSICCLRELVAIINCVESSPNSVMPVFYGIHPSEVLFQNGCYEKAFSEHEERFREHKQRMEEVRRWRLALTRVAGFPGLHIKNPSLLGDLDVQYAVDILGREFSTLQNETIYSRHGTLGLTEPPYIEEWHNLIKIELIENKICELPQSLDRPKLRVKVIHMKSQETLDDGFSWRKYGLKEVLGSKYLREYYRCSHGGCLAKKRVQRLDEDPTTFEVSYNRNHTCTQKQNLITESGVEAEFQEQ